MGSVFGKRKSESRITDHDQAVFKLKKQRDEVRQLQRRISAELERDRQMAKTLIANGQKLRAKSLLRKKRYAERLLLDTDSQLERLETMVRDLEFAQIQNEVLSGLKDGNDALKRAHAVFSIEEVEQIMETTREGAEKQREIDDLIAGNLDRDDEMQVEEELQAIIDEQKEMEKKEEKNVELPEVPQQEIEDVELAEEERPSRAKQRAERVPEAS